MRQLFNVENCTIKMVEIVNNIVFVILSNCDLKRQDVKPTQELSTYLFLDRIICVKSIGIAR